MELVVGRRVFSGRCKPQRLLLAGSGSGAMGAYTSRKMAHGGPAIGLDLRTGWRRDDVPGPLHRTRALELSLLPLPSHKEGWFAPFLRPAKQRLMGRSYEIEPVHPSGHRSSI